MLLAGVSTAPASAEDSAIYQWTDPDGIVRYTRDRGRIPRSERDHVVRLEPGMAATTPPAESATPAGTIPSMLGGSMPEGATADPDQPSLTTTAPTPAPAPRSDGESQIGQPIPAPEAAGSAPVLEPPAAGPAPADSSEQGAGVLPSWWGDDEGRGDDKELGDPRGWGDSEGSADLGWLDARELASPWGVPLGAAPNPSLAQLQSETETADAPPDDLDARIRRLEVEVTRDEERLKDMISNAQADAVPELQNSPELREIARRLPGLQSELAALKRERASRQTP
jgi:hypothetical protein